jgi:cell division protein FtsI (penicillin-binding protein 3)
VSSEEPKVSRTEKHFSALGPKLLQIDRAAGDSMPDFRGMSARQVLQVMERMNLNVHIDGYGRVVNQTPAPGGTIDPDTRISVLLQPPE